MKKLLTGLLALFTLLCASAQPAVRPALTPLKPLLHGGHLDMSAEEAHEAIVKTLNLRVRSRDELKSSISFPGLTEQKSYYAGRVHTEIATDRMGRVVILRVTVPLPNDVPLDRVRKDLSDAFGPTIETRRFDTGISLAHGGLRSGTPATAERCSAQQLLQRLPQPQCLWMLIAHVNELAGDRTLSVSLYDVAKMQETIVSRN